MENEKTLCIFGAGGHGKVVAEALQLLGFSSIEFWDDRPLPPIFGIHVVSPNLSFSLKKPCILGIGDLSIRRKWIDQIDPDFFWNQAIIHPTAFVAPSAKIGIGAFIAPKVVIHTSAQIGNHAIINSGAVIDHDVIVGENTHIAPGAVVCGDVQIGKNVFIGPNATVIRGIQIGDDVFIKAGSLVKNNIPSGGVL
jgi:sugar O-acyltransferase (sialic acid O-acetyltransferase NeuD family)